MPDGRDLGFDFSVEPAVQRESGICPVKVKPVAVGYYPSGGQKGRKVGHSCLGVFDFFRFRRAAVVGCLSLTLSGAGGEEKDKRRQESE